MLNRVLLVSAKSGALFRDVARAGTTTGECAVAGERSRPGFECWACALATRAVQRAIAKNMRDESRDSRAGNDCDAVPWSQASRRGRQTRGAFAVRQSSRTDANRMRLQATWQRSLEQSTRADAENSPNRAAFDICEFRDGASRAESATIYSPRESNKPAAEGPGGPRDSSNGDLHSVFGRHP